ncbi:hypothetical protein BC827DRAFT_1161493 [Russula dissimulans]|nr:hypothetical protein BC827DRAFT_1161493 [Russula dissimulans]
MHSRIAVNQPDFQISVSATHTLDDHKTELSLPCIVDARFISGIHFSFSGTVDHSTSISPNDMLRSFVVQSFRRYLIINAEHLGITNISDAILDNRPSGTSGAPTVFVTPADCASSASPHSHVLFIHLAYNWKSLSQLSSGLSIFSPQSLLPVQPALNQLLRKLFSAHIVGRYPWLFGPLRTKHHLEQQWFPSLARSLLAITDRSRSLMFRNKIQELLKAEDLLTPSDFPETEECHQKIENLVSAYKQATDATCSCLSLHSRSRGCLSDSPVLNTNDTLIVALELILKVTTRPPPFRVRFCQEQPPAGVTPRPGPYRPAVSTQFSSDDETLDLSGLHHPSKDSSDDPLHWDDLPADADSVPCLSGDTWSHLSDDNLWSSDSEDVIVSNGNLDLACPLPPSEAEDLIPEIPLTRQLNWDSGVDEEDGGFPSRDVSSPLSELWCTTSHEKFIALDHDLDVPADLCIFDEDVEDAVMLLAFD